MTQNAQNVSKCTKCTECIKVHDLHDLHDLAFAKTTGGGQTASAFKKEDREWPDTSDHSRSENSKILFSPLALHRGEEFGVLLRLAEAFEDDLHLLDW